METPFNSTWDSILNNLPYTKEQINSVPGLTKAIQSGFNWTPPQVLQMQLQNAMSDPVGFVKNNLGNAATQSQFYGNDAFNQSVNFLQQQGVPAQDLQNAVNNAGEQAQNFMADYRQQAINFEKLAGPKAGSDGLFGGLNDVGTAIAKNPILSAGVGAVLVANGVPPEVAAGLIKANQGGTPQQVLTSAAAAGLISNALAPTGAVSTPVYSPTVTPTDLPPINNFVDALNQSVQSVVPDYTPSLDQFAQAPANLVSDVASTLPTATNVADLSVATPSPTTLGDLISPQVATQSANVLPSTSTSLADLTQNYVSQQPPTDIFANPDYSQYTQDVTPNVSASIQPSIPTDIFASPDYSQYTQATTAPTFDTAVQPTFDTNVFNPPQQPSIPTDVFANPNYSQYTEPQTIGSLAQPNVPTDIFANPSYGASGLGAGAAIAAPAAMAGNDAATVMAGYTEPLSNTEQVMAGYTTPMSNTEQVMAGYTTPTTGPSLPPGSLSIPGGGLAQQAGTLYNNLTGTPVGQAATIGALGSLLQGYLGSNAATQAAQIQAAATQNAINQMTGVYNQTSAQNAPYRGLGYQAVNTLGSLLPGQAQQFDASGNPIGTAAGSGYLTQQFSPQDFAAGIDPGYAFRLQQGQMANQRAGNVAGGALSGNVLKGLQDYTQGAASQEYQNAFNRFQTQRQNIYSNLANIAGMGQTSQGQQNQLASDLAKTTAQMQVGNAAAQAAGQIGQANAYGNAIGGIGNAVTLAALLGQKQNVNAPTTTNPVTGAANTLGSLNNLANTGNDLYNYFG